MDSQDNVLSDSASLNVLCVRLEEEMNIADSQEDEERSEATFSLTVQNISNLKDGVLSEPTIVRTLPWKISAMQRQDRNSPESKSLGFFLQCNADSDSTTWSCNAVAELRLKRFKPNGEPFVRNIKHHFCSKENDWGFSYFISWNEILAPENGFIQNNSIVLEVHVEAEAPHGWYSKKHISTVSLNNQEAMDSSSNVTNMEATTSALNAAETADSQEDEERSEATFSLTVQNFSNLKDCVMSEPIMLRTLPWKILAMQIQDRKSPDSKSLAFFLQCNDDSDSTSWSCNAVAELRLKSFKPNGKPFVRNIKHHFCSKENDWGYTYFISLGEILAPENGFIQNDSIVLEVHVEAEAPRGWDSKKHQEAMDYSSNVTNVEATTSASNAAETAVSQENDERSEATFSFTVQNLSKLKDSVLSEPTMVRNLPWKIVVMPRHKSNSPDSKSLGFFLQCNGDSDSTSWCCTAVAELRLKSFKPNEVPFVRNIKHHFCSKEKAWGFSNFISWSEILDPEKGFIQNDSIVLEVHVEAEAPHGVFSKSYINSLLQTLCFTNQLRNAVNISPVGADLSSKSVGLAWQRSLLDKLESKIKSAAPNLFEGKMVSYVKCKNVDYKRTFLRTYYDIQLNIKGKKNIYESFGDYIAPETLNKYDAGIHGLQEAEEGIHFISFPPVLHLDLMRFQFDSVTGSSVKIHDRFEFYEEINLDKFFLAKNETPADYKLHAVLAHSGDNPGGQYVLYENANGKWCKFVDDMMYSCSKTEAIDTQRSNAYMLVYTHQHLNLMDSLVLQG